MAAAQNSNPWPVGAGATCLVRKPGVQERVAGSTEAARVAWSKSFLAGQSKDIRDELLADSRVATFPAGTLIDTGQDYQVCLIHSGRIAAKVVSGDGREVTTRYLSVGQISALPAMLTHGAPSQLEAVSHTQVSLLNPVTFRRLLQTRPELTYAVAVHLAECTYDAVLRLEDNIFKTVQQRVSRHLLEMATPTVNGLLVQTDQSALANSIGSVREVVSRALKKLSDAGAIRRSRRQIWIEDPKTLRAIASDGRSDM